MFTKIKLLAVAILFVACGSPDGKDRVKTASMSPEEVAAFYLAGPLQVALELDGASDDAFAFVQNALTGYVVTLSGGKDCWGPQGSSYDSDSKDPLVVRRGATGCGLVLTQLRFEEAASTLVFLPADASGLPVAAGQSAAFSGQAGKRHMLASIVKGFATTGDGKVSLRAVEAAVNGDAISVLKSCVTPWGVEIPHGSAVKGFNLQLAPYGARCQEKTLLCSNGSLSDAAVYKFAACSETRLVKLVVTSDKTDIAVGESTQLRAVATYSDGSSRSFSPASWSVTPASIATVTTAGVLVGNADGQVAVKAEHDGVSSNTIQISVYRMITQTVVLLANSPSTVNGKTVPGFIQQLKFYQAYSGGVGLNADAASATQACKHLGFTGGRAASSSNYVAPYNETLWYFNGNGFTYKKSKASDRDHINVLHCDQVCKVSGSTKQCSPY